MTDMLINLSGLTENTEARRRREGQAIVVRPAMAYEKTVVIDWVAEHFSRPWADETGMAFAGHPIGCHLAVMAGHIVGFCCVDCTYKGFLGPVGIDAARRGMGIGKALVQNALQAMKAAGYAYAIVGNVGAPSFFQKAAGAVPIADTLPGAYPPPLSS